jgi:hypothetical protein
MLRFHTPALRTGRAALPHPALLRNSSLCIRRGAPFGRPKQPERVVEVTVEIPFVSRAAPLFTSHHPPAETSLRVPANKLIRLLHRALVEIPSANTESRSDATGPTASSDVAPTAARAPADPCPSAPRQSRRIEKWSWWRSRDKGQVFVFDHFPPRVSQVVYLGRAPSFPDFGIKSK